MNHHQQPYSNQQQGIMQQPPAVVSTKDQLYLTDMLSWNLLAMKKAHLYAQICNDQDVKQAIDQAGQMHARHYQTILNHLHSNQMMQ